MSRLERYSRGIESSTPKHPPRRVVTYWSGSMYQPCTSVTVNSGEQRGLTVNEKSTVTRGESHLPGAQRTHNPKVAGSNPAPATKWKARKQCVSGPSAFSGGWPVYRGVYRRPRTRVADLGLRDR